MMLMLPMSVEQAARAASPASARMHFGMNCRMAHLATTPPDRILGQIPDRILHPVLGQILPNPTLPINVVVTLALGIVPHSMRALLTPCAASAPCRPAANR